MDELTTDSRDIALVELLDRVVGKGVILSGDITISVADVDLIYLGLRVLIRSTDKPPSRKIERDSASEERSEPDERPLHLRDRSTRHFFAE